MAVDMCKSINGNFIVVDCDGIGIGAYQELMKLSPKYLEGIHIVKFHGSIRLPRDLKEKDNYYNLRTEAAFVTQKRARKGFAALNEKHTEMIEDLMEDEWFEQDGFIRLIEKEDIKERLLRSPGKGDAYKMAQWALEKDFKFVKYESENIVRIAPESTPLFIGQMAGITMVPEETLL
jgi:hypothetical protein